MGTNQSKAPRILEELKTKGALGKDGNTRSFYTLWDNESSRIWENVPEEDLVDSIVEGTGRQDWVKLRPFDLLPDLKPETAGYAGKVLMAGETLRIGCEAICGTQPYFSRAGDFQTVFFQFAGRALVETSFGIHEMEPGEALFIPAMVAHRTTGGPGCRRMVFYPRDTLQVKLDPENPVTEIRYRVRRAGESDLEERVPEPAVPPDGKVMERLTHWDSQPGDETLFKRTHRALVGGAESSVGPVKVRPFDYFTSPPSGPKAKPVRTALLWESPTFRQRVYSNPGAQPAPHRGYDEDEYWFQFSGRVEQIGEHGVYPISAGDVSMAEAGISHTSINVPGSLRLTTYTNKPIRRLIDPKEHLCESQWEVAQTVVRGWQGD